MIRIVSPHDRVFRAALSDTRVAREFFSRHLAPEIVQAVDLNTLELCPQSYIDNELKLSQSDILYKVKIAEAQGYLYALCEHQRTPDPLMPFRMLKYHVGIWETHLKQTKSQELPLIVSLIFYNGQAPYNYSTDFKDLLKAPPQLIEQVWGKPFPLINVHAIPDEELRRHQWSGVLEFFMKHAAARDVLPYLQQIVKVLGELEAQGGADYVVVLLNYMFNVAETVDVGRLVATVKSGLSEEVGEKVMTIAEQLIERGKRYGLEQGIEQGMQRGIEQGIQQGMQQGMRQGEYLLFMCLLKHKFSLVPEKYLSLINQADERQLLEWSERFVNAQTLGDIFEE